ncbi:MAG: DUF4347 domain-containing protein [Thermoguttaceae bacterium]
MAVNLWAYSQNKLAAGQWHPGNGWTHCHHIESLEELTEYLELEGLRLDKLGILVHGAAGSLEGFAKDPIPYHKLPKYESHFKRIGKYLTGKPGRLIFFACNVGDGLKGDKALSMISKWVHPAEVAGFEVQGVVFRPVGPSQAAGGVKPNLRGGGQVRPEDHLRDPYLTEWHFTAKWACGGWIVRPGTYADLRSLLRCTRYRIKNARGLCGSRQCNGHALAGIDLLGYGAKLPWCRPYKRDPRFMEWFEKYENRLDDVRQLYPVIYGRVPWEPPQAKHRAGKRTSGRLRHR